MDQSFGDGGFFGRDKIIAMSLVEMFFQTSRCRTRRLSLLCKRSSRIFQFKMWSVSRNRKSKRRNDFYEGDRSTSWSTITFECLVLKTQHWILPIYSLLLSVMTTFRNSIRDGTKFNYRCQKFHPMTCRKSVHIEDTQVRSTQTRIGFCDMKSHQKILIHNLWSWKQWRRKKNRSETSIVELWHQTWKNWTRSYDQESKESNRRWTS